MIAVCVFGLSPIQANIIQLSPLSFGGASNLTPADLSELSDADYFFVKHFSEVAESSSAYKFSKSIFKTTFSEQSRPELMEFETGALETLDTFYSTVSIDGVPLNYPNPFSMRSGTHIGYNMSEEGRVEILVYNALGRLVYTKICEKGMEGGKANYNKVPINLKIDGLEKLSSGALFYLIVHQGEVLAKGKMAMVP